MKRFFFLFLFFNNLQRLSIALLETDFVKFPILVFPYSSSRLYEKDETFFIRNLFEKYVNCSTKRITRNTYRFEKFTFWEK